MVAPPHRLVRGAARARLQVRCASSLPHCAAARAPASTRSHHAAVRPHFGEVNAVIMHFAGQAAAAQLASSPSLSLSLAPRSWAPVMPSPRSSSSRLAPTPALLSAAKATHAPLRRPWAAPRSRSFSHRRSSTLSGATVPLSCSLLVTTPGSHSLPPMPMAQFYCRRSRLSLGLMRSLLGLRAAHRHNHRVPQRRCAPTLASPPPQDAGGCAASAARLERSAACRGMSEVSVPHTVVSLGVPQPARASQLRWAPPAPPGPADATSQYARGYACVFTCLPCFVCAVGKGGGGG